MVWRKAFLVVFLSIPNVLGTAAVDPMLSSGRAPDSTAKVVAEIRDAERRRIPLEVVIKASEHYSVGGPVEVTVIVTNLFDTPLLMNSRMLVNHARLQGEVSFHITDPSGKRVDIKRYVTPLSIRDNDFVLLNRGESIQRTVDLADLYGINVKGTYKIQASYHNEVDHSNPSGHAWKGYVISEPIELTLN
jgi:hypothetical protein